MKFYCRIEKTLRGNIMIGVVDLHEQKDARSSYKTGNAICFNALNGIIHYGLKVKPEKSGIFESEIMCVIVDFNKATVEWNIDGKRLATTSSPFLTNKKRMFIPYVEMCNTGDKISWWY